jgi:hypothetical protein
MLKSLIWWNLLEKREAFLYEKALKTDICAALRAYSIIWLEKMKFLAVRIALFTKTLRFSLRYGSHLRFYKN